MSVVLSACWPVFLQSSWIDWESGGTWIFYLVDHDLWGLVPGEGFEPPTFSLQNCCTTTVLTRHL